MGDAEKLSGPMRNLIVSTPEAGYAGHEQSVAPEQQTPAAFSTTPDPHITSHPVAGDSGIVGAQLVQQPQGYHFNQPQYVQGPPFLPQRSHSTPHHQYTQTVRNGANVPRVLPIYPQIPQQGVQIPPNNNQRLQAGHAPEGMAYQLSHQVHQYQGGSVSPTPNGQYPAPGYQHTIVGSYGQHYTHVYTQHRDPQAQAQSSSYAVSYCNYPPHYPQPTGPTQAQFPPWQMNPHYAVPPHYLVHQIPTQQLPHPPQGQAPPGHYVRRHSFPRRQLPLKRRGSDSERTGGTQFVGYPGVPRWDGRTANATAAGPGVGVGGGRDAATSGYAEPSARGPSQGYCPASTLSPPQLELSQPNDSAETSGALEDGKTPGTLDSPLPPSASLLHPSLPRGPPRKPKQSGNALWVGNLPVGAQVVDLKEYFSKDAKNDIESVFLISKSNCAFVNYRTHEACSAALVRFHDSRFQNTKLVCRLRRNSAPSAAAGAVAAVPSPDPSAHSARDSGDEATDVSETEEAKDGGVKSPPAGPKVTGRSVGKDRIFIVKSLTVEDLAMSVRTGIWATQFHNESILNQAFQTADNVYLIFSANKSGEYYGYARMASPILDDQTGIEWSPSSQPHEDADLPLAIYTPATELAPQGRIIDDSARGTIFWEAISDDEVPNQTVTTNEEDGEHEEGPVGVARSWGKPFRVEWICTKRLPFYRTKGLRNIWNANREVKIARDGTELEENVGKKVILLFHRNGNGTAPDHFSA